jgi:glycosyltransferase involved in cell wall biosynthesis
VDGLVFVVEEQKEFYTGWRAKRAVVHNYPDPDAFANPQPVPDLPAGRFRLVYIGSIYARRGIMTMLEALEHRLEGHVTFLGWVDHARIKDYLASADVAWLPGLPVKQYRHRAISTKQLECMLMGLPIVSSDHPHRREFIEEAQCGFSVTADDPAAHAEAVLWLYRHPQERRAMGARGRQLVLDKYSWSKEAIVLRAFYEQLLEQES